jgi:hypothetical protein
LLEDLELNPLLVYRNRAVTLDARIILGGITYIFKTGFKKESVK